MGQNEIRRFSIRGAEMAQGNPQIPWTDEQWARVNQVIQEEAHRARIDHQEAADETVAKADDLADRLQRHHRAQHARARLRLAARLRPGRRR